MFSQGRGTALFPVSGDKEETVFPTSFRETEQGGRNVKKQLPGWAVLLIITLVAGLALGGTYALTKEPIAQQALLTAENARKSALPDADSFEELELGENASVDWAYAGLKEGNTVGYVAQKTVNGFGGKVEVIAGVDTQKAPDTFTVSGISVGGSNFSETAGLGARSKEPAFTEQFAGKLYPLSYIKAGGEATDSTVDALTSATITTTAVVNGVNDIVKYIKGDVMGIAGVEMPAKPESGVFSASSKGFRGPVYVEAAFDGAGKVTYMSVGDENFAEDIGVGVVEPDFMIQFIGKQMPLEVADIDVIAGATISSTAVVNALNDAYAIAGGAEIVAPETPAMPEKPEEGVYSASAQGFRGPVYVEAAFDENDQVTYLSVGDEGFAEDIGLGVKEPDFMYQFIGKKAPLEVADIDVIAGATISSTAVVNALNGAYNASKGIVVETPQAQLPEKPEGGAVYSASAQGFGGPVAVEASFDEEGKITYISIGDSQFAETPGLGARALEDDFQAQFIGKQMPLSLSDIDALTGATITSTAVVDALNQAYDISQGRGAEPASAPEAQASEKPAVTFGADAFGFESDVYVEAAFEDGRITWISIGDKRFAETPGLGAKALEEEFQAQFIGKAVPLALEDIDAISGATFTSTAVVEAINKAYEKSLTAAEAPAQAPAAESAGATYSASAQGFGGPVAVEASFDEEGRITALTIGDSQFAETPGLGAKALEEEFQAQFIGKQMPLTLSDIDAISGATVTSTAVVDALNEAYALSGGGQRAESEALTTSFSGEINAGSKLIKLTAQVENGLVAALSVTPSELEAAMQEKFLGAALPVSVEEEDIDVFSVAVLLNQAYQQYLKEHPDAPAAVAEAAQEEEKQPALPADFKDVRHSIGITSLSTDIQVKVSFVQDTVAGLVVMEKPVGSDQAYTLSEQDGQMKDLFLARSLPLDVSRQESPFAALVASAINTAYYANGGNKNLVSVLVDENAAGEDENGVIGGADGPTVLIVAQPSQEDGWYTSEVISFFTAIQVSAQFEDGKVAALTVADKQVGEEAYQPSEKESAMQEKFTGASLPLDTDQPDPYTAAVAIAINQAYPGALSQENTLPQAPGDAVLSSGECVIFFSRVRADARFEDGKLSFVSVRTSPIGEHSAGEETTAVDEWAALLGQPMPLNAADCQVAGVPEYMTQAVVIALNQAYENSLAGQQ